MSIAREKGYIGETKTQLRHGYGVYKYPNQFFRYEGEWKHGKKHGHGKLLMGDGSYYEGEFINGEIEGHGFRKWASSGNTYSGQFCNGELNGYGVMNYSSGAVYEGQFQCNKKEGRGVMKFEDGSIYEGLFHNNLRHGEGSMTFSNGDCYIGDWVNDKRQGSGELRLKDGSVYDGQWRSDFYNGAGTFIHISGVTYDGMWINGKPAVDAAKIVITTEECQELSQDAPFSVAVEIRSEEGEVVSDEQGRELHIAAGFKHYVPGQGSPLLALIEDLQESPIPTPYYDVINYPITEYSFLEERLKPSNDPPSGETDTSPSAVPSADEQDVANGLEDSVANLDLENSDNPTTGDDVSLGDLDKPARRPEDGEPLMTEQETGATEDTEVAMEMRDDQTEVRGVAESPLPPPVGNDRCRAGKLQFESLILPGIPSTGETPLPVTPPNSSLSDKSTKGKAKGGKAKGRGAQDDLSSPPDQINFEKIKDPKLAKAKRERLYGDERFARPGEYIIIITDVTDPPFMGTTLPPVYCRIKILHPRKVKKEKTAANKSKSSSKAPE